jgi:cytochrome P450
MTNVGRDRHGGAPHDGAAEQGVPRTDRPAEDGVGRIDRAVLDHLPEIDLTDPEVLRDPFAAYGAARERSPVARMQIPGLGQVWVVTRHDDARMMLSDPRFEINAASFIPPGVPDEYLPYMQTMAEQNGAAHMRLRKLVAPAFTARRAADFRPRIERIVESLLAELSDHAGPENNPEAYSTADSTAFSTADRGVGHRSVDLLRHYARPLPIEVICELVGIAESDRPAWRDHGALVAAGAGQGFADALPAIMDGAKAAIALRHDEPADDLLSDLIRAQADDGDRLSDAEMVTLVWHLVLAGQTPTNLLANSVHALLAHPDQLAAVRDDPALMPRAVEELIRWHGPTLLTIPRYAREDVQIAGVLVSEGDAVTASVAAANRDPRAFTGTDPDRLDIHRTVTPPGHLGFAHGPHFCLGSALARVETEVALTMLFQRFPDLALAPSAEVRHAPDPGTWRLASLPVTL